MKPDLAKQFRSWGQEALKIEAAAILAGAERLGDDFVSAIEGILSCQGKLVVTGLGKSGHIARKVASTLSSTGTSSFFLHPTEALHGDFGMLQPKDWLLAIAYGGETSEVLEVCRFARRIGVPIVAITGKKDSTLAKLANFVVDVTCEREADSLNLAPTSSSTLSMAAGDAIAVTLMRARGFSEIDFAALHPGGSLGRRLSLVKDHMKPKESLPLVAEDADFHKVLEIVTARNFGIAGVVSAKGELIGAVSDGDLRRALLQSGAEALRARASQMMSKTPKTVTSDSLALDALTLMNDKQITQLFVVASKETKIPTGIVRLHDLLAARIL
jgi:arabinose-5-phosphate isomerase